MDIVVDTVVSSVALQGVATLVASCVAWIVYDVYFRYPHLPPGMFRWPVIGNLNIMLNFPFLVLDKVHKKLGRPGILSMQLGGKYAVVLCDYDTAYEAQTAKEVDGRPLLRASHNAAPQMGTFMPGGKSWAKRRAHAMTYITASKNATTQKHIFDKEIAYLLENLKNAAAKTSTDVGINPFEFLQHTNLNIILTLLMGLRFEFDSDDAHRLQRINKSVFIGAAQGSPRDFISWAPEGPHVANVRKLKVERDACIKHFYKKVYDSYDPNVEPRHFVDHSIKLCEALKAKGDDTYKEFTFDKIYDYCVGDFVIGAGETTAVMIWWAFVYLVKQPHWFDKIYAEIESVCQGEKVTMKIAQELNITKAVVEETTRIRSPPLGFPRKNSQAVKIKNYTIPKDTIFLTNLYSITHDERVWPEPHAFKPERFLNSNNEFVVKEKYKNAPFGYGRRSCPGKDLARYEMYLYLATFVQTFVITLPNDGIDHGDAYNPEPSLTPEPMRQNFVFTPRSS